MKKLENKQLIIISVIVVAVIAITLTLCAAFGVFSGEQQPTEDGNGQAQNPDEEEDPEDNSDAPSGEEKPGDTPDVPGGEENPDSTPDLPDSEEKPEDRPDSPGGEGNSPTPPENEECTPGGEHNWKQTRIIRAVSCTEDGIAEYSCSCGEVKLELLSSDGHKFGDWSIEFEPTCFTYGEKSRVCSLCKYKELSAVDMLEHEYSQSGEENGIRTFECKYCKDSFSVNAESSSATVILKEQNIFGCDTDFSFDIISSGDEAYIRKNLTIINNYYNGYENDNADEAIFDYNLEKIGENVWRVSPAAEYTPGDTYRAKRRGEVIFKDWGVCDLTFSITKQETNIVNLNDGIVYLGALEKNAPGYFPYAIEESKNTDAFWLSIGKVEGLKVGDVICVGSATDESELLVDGGNNCLGKIKSIDKIKSTDRYIIQLSRPSVSEVFDELEIYTSHLKSLQSAEFNEDFLEYTVDTLNKNEDFRKLLYATYSTSAEYMDAKGFAPLANTFKEFMESLEITSDFGKDNFEIVDIGNDKKAIRVKVNVLGEGAIPINLTGDEYSEQVGEISLSFEAYVILDFTLSFKFQNKKHTEFEFVVEQSITTGFNFSIETEVDYSAKSRPYVWNVVTGTYHYKNCKHVAQVKDSNKLKRLSVEEMLKLLGDENACKKECNTCLPITSMMSTMFVINTESGLVHNCKCTSVAKISSDNLMITERSLDYLSANGYKTDCGNCDLTSVVNNGFDERVLKKMQNEDLGELLKDSTALSDAIGTEVDPAEKPLGSITFSITGTGLDTTTLKLYAYVDFKIEASLNYSFQMTHKYNYGLTLTKRDLRPINTEIEKNIENKITVVGKTRLDIGLKGSIIISILGTEKFAVASAAVALRVGAYGELSGILHLDDSNVENEYHAAYFETGLHFDVTVCAEVFEIKFVDDKEVLTGDYPFYKLGYEKVYYGFKNLPTEWKIYATENSMAEDGLLDVKYFDLKEMKEKTATLDVNSDRYTVNLILKSGETNCYISNGVLYVKDGVTEFETELTIRIEGGDTWGDFKEGNSKFSIPEMTIKVFYSENSTDALEYLLNEDENSYSVIGIGGYKDSELLIPETYKNLPVTAIYEGAFENNLQITSVCMSESVKNIGERAFLGCLNLATVSLSDGLEIIGDGAFFGCKKIEKITVPNTVTSIGVLAFSECEKLSSVTLGNSVASIGSAAFKNCVALSAVSMPASVLYVGEAAYENCTNINTLIILDLAAWCNITFGSDTANPMIFATTVYGVTESGRLEIPDGVTMIHSYAFINCRELVDLVLADSVESIGTRAFDFCTKLSKVTLSNGLKSIGDGAFSSCEKLSAVTMPETLTEIGEMAFYKCMSLTNINIPSSVESVGMGAFVGCTNLKSVDFESPDSWYVDGKKISENELADPERAAQLLINSDYAGAAWRRDTVDPGNSSENLAYRLNDDGQSYSVIGIGECKDINIVIPSTHAGLPVTAIGSQAFRNCDSLTSVTIPNGVTSIGSSAFWNCDSLTSVTIPDSVTTIGDFAFHDCDSLTGVTIPDSVTSIGDYAFHDCDSLTSITVDEANTAYKDIDGNLYTKDGKTLIQYAIGKSDTSFTIPDSVTTIGSWAFYGCDSLTSVTIGNGVTTIGTYAFHDCESLTGVTIGNSVTTIGTYAFHDCDSLTGVTIPDSATSIGKNAFSRCDSLTSITVDEANTAYKDIDGNLYTKDGKTLIQYAIGKSDTSFTIPDSVTSIGDSAFEDCDSLTGVTIGNGVTSIGSYAFQYCYNLTGVTIGKSVTSIGSYAFEYCYNLTGVTIGNSVTSIGDYAFYGCDKLVEVINHSSLNITVGSEDHGYVAYYAKTVHTGESKIVKEGDYIFITLDGVNYLVNYVGTETDITLPENYNGEGYVINDYAFRGCSSLTSVTIPDSVTTIGNYAFRGCTGLTSVTIGNSVTSIGERAFDFCVSLESVTIPDSVTSIGKYAFSGCYSLTGVVFKNPNGWKAGSASLSSSDLSNAETAAKYLATEYYSYSWVRE